MNLLNLSDHRYTSKLNSKLRKTKVNFQMYIIYIIHIKKANIGFFNGKTTKVYSRFKIITE